MVGMFVRDEYRLHSSQGYPIDLKCGTESPEAYAAVDENAALFRTDEGGITLAGAE